MNQLQEVIASNWARIEGERAANTTRLYWRARLREGDRLPTKEILNIVVEDCAAIRAHHDLWPEDQRREFPAFVLAMLAEQWLAANRLKLRRLIEAEGER